MFPKDRRKTTKTWKQIKPQSRKARLRILKKYGQGCFLDPHGLKYPICNKYNGKKECLGHYAAQYYLRIHSGKLKRKRNKIDTRKRKKYIRLLDKSKSFTSKQCNKN